MSKLGGVQPGRRLATIAWICQSAAMRRRSGVGTPACGASAHLLAGVPPDVQRIVHRAAAVPLVHHLAAAQPPHIQLAVLPARSHKAVRNRHAGGLQEGRRVR